MTQVRRAPDQMPDGLKNPLCLADGKCPGVCVGCLELATDKEFQLAHALARSEAELSTLRAATKRLITAAQQAQGRLLVIGGNSGWVVTGAVAALEDALADPTIAALASLEDAKGGVK